MKETGIVFVIDAALEHMVHDGASADHLRKYRRSGFGAIQQYCQQNGITDYSPETIDRFVLQMRNEYERCEISRFRWGIARRSAELLKQFHISGTLALQRCSPWKSLHNPLHREPASHEAENPDSIIALVRRTEQALAAFELTPKTLQNYRYDGFDRILRRHNDLGLTDYSPALTNEIVVQTRAAYEKGEICRSVYQNVRKTAALLAEVHSTGVVIWRQLQNYRLRQVKEGFSEMLDIFCADALKTGSIKAGTVTQATYFIRQLLFELEDSGFYSFENVTPRILNECITRVAQRYSSGTSTMLSGVKMFLKHLYSRGTTEIDLSKSLPEHVAPRKPIREGFSEEEISRLLAATDRTTAIGKRDYAIMLLASQTGMRGCDIVKLRRQEIHWHTKEIMIVQEKTGVAVTIPLPIESGNAIADYLLNARPFGGEPYIFLRKDRPYRRLKRICGVMPRYIQKAGITDNASERRGFHSFRRKYGRQLLEAEIPMDMFGELLGQTNIDSAKPYMAIDETGLKFCALGLVCPAIGGAEI
jgi:site-specific recombinase XerD